MNFKICEEVSALGLKVAFLVIHNIDNNQYDNSLEHKIDEFYTQFLNEYSTEHLENDSNIIGYRKLHKKIGITDKNLIASPESLIKLLFKHKSLRPINFIVDTYNYIAIKNKVSIGAHDLKHINGNVRLCFTKGDERFIPLGKKLCRLDCRQCNKTKTTTDTRDCLFIIQGHKNITSNLIKSTAEELLTIFSPYITDEKECILKIK